MYTSFVSNVVISTNKSDLINVEYNNFVVDNFDEAGSHFDFFAKNFFASMMW